MEIKILTAFLLLGMISSRIYESSILSELDRLLTGKVKGPTYELKVKNERKAGEISDDFFKILQVPDELPIKHNEKTDQPEYEYQETPNDRFDNISHIYVLVDNIQELINSKILGSIGTEFMLNNQEKTYSFYSKMNKVYK